ncbi:hypothetical protein YDYSY3_58720 [Paenibacillus chitinolyticus]|nr:hypothetical protein YDYSY3_58720 [Paenibacillus chitinolyticus]
MLAISLIDLVNCDLDRNSPINEANKKNVSSNSLNSASIKKLFNSIGLFVRSPTFWYTKVESIIHSIEAIFDSANL